MDHNGLRCVFAENEYGTYCIPKSSVHRPAAQHVISGQVWEPDTLKFIRDNCEENGIIFHAGTYFGDFLPALSECYKVLAYEPSLENYRCAELTILMNELTNVKLSHMALGEICDSANVQTFNQNNVALGGAAKILPESNKMTERVRITTIDHERAEHQAWGDISIIQLDVEGYEGEALKGAIRSLRAQKPILILEVWNDNVLQTDFFQETIFGELGYIEDGRLHDNIVLRTK